MKNYPECKELDWFLSGICGENNFFEKKKKFEKKNNFEKKSADDAKNMKNYPDCKELDWFLSRCCGENNFLERLILRKVSRRH